MVKKYIALILLAVLVTAGCPTAYAADLLPQPVFRWEKDANTPASNWLINAYEVDCVTRKDTYTTTAATVANDNPVVLNSRGEADIFWSGIYCVVVTNSVADGSAIQKTIAVYGSASTASSVNAGNAISNGSFETDSDGDGVPDNWVETPYTGGTAAVITSDQQHGTDGYQFTSTGTGGGQIINDSFFPVDPLRTYNVSFMLKSSVVDIRNFVEIVYYTSAFVEVTTATIYDEAAANPTSWTKKSADVTPGSTVRYAKIRMFGAHDSDATSGNVIFDDVRVVPKDWTDTNVATSVPGLVIRPQFSFGSTTTLTFSAGVYHADGTTEQMLEWNSLLTFTPGSGGSNAASTDLGNNQTHYVFVDDSAVVTLGLAVLTNAEFINTIVAPTWSETKHGWYTGSDRCIFSFTTDGSANIEDFAHAGNLVTYASAVEDANAVDYDTTYLDLTLTAPGFATEMYISVSSIVLGTTSPSPGFQWRTNGQSGNGLPFPAGLANAGSTGFVISDSSQVVEFKDAVSGTNTFDIWTNGWLFPRGM